MKQIDLFEWAASRPSADVIDIMPALIRKIASEAVWPPTPKSGEIVMLKRGAA
ncbi:hypothetical protein [Rhizobium johnstonii]|uniref:hypothetical protein n=1 Tax=Rhizobium johnstonii TaxID=3019933 RepID=UPI003F9773DB